jgi:hypothetical protein
MARDEAHVPKEQRVEVGLSKQFGTVGGPLAAWAEALGVEPDAVLQRVDALGIRLMVDTGVDNQGDKSYDRPSDAETRRLVLRKEDANEVLPSSSRFSSRTFSHSD